MSPTKPKGPPPPGIVEVARPVGRPSDSEALTGILAALEGRTIGTKLKLLRAAAAFYGLDYEADDDGGEAGS